jgi:hypothetical protein
MLARFFMGAGAGPFRFGSTPECALCQWPGNEGFLLAGPLRMFEGGAADAKPVPVPC